MKSNNKKVLLIQPAPVIKFGYLFQPLSLLTVAEHLVHDGFKVTILDQTVDNFFLKNLYRKIKKKPICIGLTCITGQNPNVFQIIKFIKSIDDRIPIVLGGCHATILPKQTLECPYIDFVVIGRTRKNFLLLVRALYFKEDISKISGIGYKKDNKIIINNQRLRTEHKSYFIKPYEIISHYLKYYTVLAIETSSGCPHNCSFCMIRSLHDGGMSFNNPKILVQEMTSILQLTTFQRIIFTDDNFFCKRNHYTKIFTEISKQIKPKIEIPIYVSARIDDILNLSHEDLLFFKNSGLKNISVGIESGSNRILQLLKKGFSIDIVIKVIEKLSKYGFSLDLQFIRGIPTETSEEWADTLKKIHEIMEISKNLQIVVFNFVPYPNTELFQIAVKEGYIMPERFEMWSMTNFFKPVNKEDLIFSEFPVHNRNGKDISQINHFVICWRKRNSQYEKVLNWV